MASITDSTVIQKLYIAYFGRPADVPGLQYWTATLADAHGDTAAITKAFAGSTEYKNLTVGQDAYHLVGQAYLAMFGRAADLPGLEYWAKGLIAGTSSVDGFMNALAHGAQGSDLTTLNNKVTFAVAFSGEMTSSDAILGYSGDITNSMTRNYMAGIASDASLAAALVPATLHDTLMDLIGYCAPTPPPPAAPAAPTPLAATDAVVLVGQAPAPTHA